MMGNPWMYFGCRCTHHIMGRGFTNGGLRFTGRNGWFKLGIGKLKGGFQLVFKPGLTVRLYFASEKWKWHAGHGCMTPDPVIVSCLERDGMIMLMDCCEFLVQQQEPDTKSAGMKVVQCH
jgi:hypothetical protein